MEFIDLKLDKYVCDQTSQESEVLYQLNRETHLTVMQPRMLSGHFQGRVLSMLSKMIRPKRILELGTYTGYSAICLAEGLESGGELITVDRNDELQQMVERFILSSGNEGRIKPLIGNALELIEEIEGDFDLVFIDADKSNYLNYYEKLMDRIPSGGYLFIDNVLWSGKVLEEAKANDKDTLVLQELNQRVVEDSRVEVVLLPIRDGLSLIRKK
jgi:predicted O-methyltransferase YrrM